MSKSHCHNHKFLLMWPKNPLPKSKIHNPSVSINQTQDYVIQWQPWRSFIPFLLQFVTYDNNFNFNVNSFKVQNKQNLFKGRIINGLVGCVTGSKRRTSVRPFGYSSNILSRSLNFLNIPCLKYDYKAIPYEIPCRSFNFAHDTRLLILPRVPVLILEQNKGQEICMSDVNMRLEKWKNLHNKHFKPST